MAACSHWNLIHNVMQPRPLVHCLGRSRRPSPGALWTQWPSWIPGLSFSDRCCEALSIELRLTPIICLSVVFSAQLLQNHRWNILSASDCDIPGSHNKSWQNLRFRREVAGEREGPSRSLQTEIQAADWIFSVASRFAALCFCPQWPSGTDWVE